MVVEAAKWRREACSRSVGIVSGLWQLRVIFHQSMWCSWETLSTSAIPTATFVLAPSGLVKIPFLSYVCCTLANCHQLARLMQLWCVGVGVTRRVSGRGFFFFVIRDNGVKYDTVNRRMEELLSSCLFLSCETSWCRNTTNLETPQTLYFQLLQGGENNSTDCGDACGAEAKFWRNLSSSNMPKPARNSFVPNSKNFICNFARVKRGQAHSSDSCQRLQCGCPKPDKW